MPRATDEAAFLAKVCANPDDDGPRLIFADYLDEIGDPRGAFIRVQCALARLDSADPSRHELKDVEEAYLARYRDNWTRPLRGLGAGELRRGFVEVVTLSAERFLSHGELLF